MNDVTQEILTRSKDILNRNVGVQELQTYLTDVFQDPDIQGAVDWVLVFQKVYLHACLKKRSVEADWLSSVGFQALDPIQQIAVRQVFAYGRVLLKSRQG